MDSLQISLLVAGGVMLLAVVVYNQWIARRRAPRQAEAVTEGAPNSPDIGVQGMQEPVLEDVIDTLPQPIRRAVLDPLIDALASIDMDHPVTAEAALAALPSTRRVGTKAFHVEGRCTPQGDWEPLQAGRRYVAFQAGVQLASRTGAINDIEYSEFVVKIQAFADAVGGSVTVGDMAQEVARGRELDQFASAHDAQLSFTLLARAAAWSPGYIHQHAARLGFVPGAMPGRMVLPSATAGQPALLALTFDAQAAMADDPTLSAVRACVLNLDVAHVAQSEQPYPRMVQVLQALAVDMDGVITDGAGQVIGEDLLQQIGADLERLYDALAQRELAAGLPHTRRLFS